MSGGSILLILALLSLSGLGICHKVADFRRCRPSAISVMLFVGAATVVWGYTILHTLTGVGVTLFPPFTARAVAVAAICGACAGIAILAFQVGVRYGRISTSWLVINLSTIVPAALSLLVYKEWKAGIKWQQLAGLVLVVLSVFLLWRDKAIEIARGEQPIPQRPLDPSELPEAQGAGSVTGVAGTAAPEEV
jgi:drug/metabolite transporter (DMT)-like permease